MKRIFLSLIFLLCSVAVLFGQKAYWDVIQLKNGKIFRGTIIEETPNGGVRIVTEDKEVYFFGGGEVDRITKAKVEKGEQPIANISSGGETKVKKVRTAPEDYEHRGYFALIEGGFLYSLVQNGAITPDSLRQNSILINTIQGVHLSPYFSLGIGLGAIFQDGNTTFPISLDLRSHFSSGRIKPFVYAAGGYALVFNDEISNGRIFGDFGFGVKTFFSPSIAFNTSLGYVPYFYSVFPEGGGVKLKDGYFAIKAGLAF